MSQSGYNGRLYTISSLCGLFGISRQGYYKHRLIESETDILISSIVFYCQHIRTYLPRAGGRQLYSLCSLYFGQRFTIGRDRFYDILRANNLMLRKKRIKPRTTNSKHPYRIYGDLLNTTPKFVAKDNCQLLVGDITYVALCDDSFAYLSLLTDGYSRCIVGYELHGSLQTDGPMKALEMAFGFYKDRGMSVKNLIHHSDRGVQYASKEYIAALSEKEVRISMTQSGDPLHNALAERMNNTIKNGWLYDYKDKTFDEAIEGIHQAVYAYNWMRPHQALNMRTPMQALNATNPNPLLVCPELAPDKQARDRETKRTEPLPVNLNSINFAACQPTSV